MDLRVLLVEPDEEVRGRVTEAIESGGGTVTAVDAGTAVGDGDDHLNAVDCAVIGHDPPTLDGVSLVERIRERRPTLPVVAFPAVGSESVASAAVSAGVTEYVERSAGVDELVATVRAVASEPGATPDSASTLEPGSIPEPASTSDPWPPSGEDPETGRAHADGGSDARATIPDPVEVPDEVPFDLKERAMDEAPVGITISDPSLPDNPLIYVNDAFERMTGYSKAETLGTNCRFLQGDETDEDAVRKMREAIENEKPVKVEVVNYTKDGDLFWNEVSIAPLTDEDGTVTNYVGFQTDVTDRKRAELAVERYADRLDAERATLERILDRVNGLIGASTETLVGATSRQGIAEGVCDLVAGTDPYVGAWVGELDLAADAVVPVAAAGLDGETDRRFDVDAVDPVATAIEDREVQVVADLADEADDWHAAVAPDATSMAVVPLVYRDNRYGVLTVYASDASAADDRERTILGALGRMIATAINAVETREILTADNVVSLTIEIADRDLFFVALSTDLDCRLEHAGTVAHDDGSMLVFFTVEGADPDAVSTAAADLDAVESATLVTESDDVALFEFATDDRSIFAELADFGATTHELVAEDGTARFRVEAPHDSAARSILSTLEDRYDGVNLAAYREHERPPTTKGEFITTLRDRLTDRQFTALQKAFVSGYYDWPRRTDGDKLAGTMGISRTTFHQHLRAAEKKLIEEFFADVQ